MDEGWQPARLINVHGTEGDEYDLTDSDLLLMQRKIVRVRPTDNPSQMAVESYRRTGCTGTRFYEIHPLDVEDVHGGTTVFVCEHECLTD